MLIWLLVILGICLIGLLISWHVHVTMVKEEGIQYDYVKFDRFLEEFNKYKNDPKIKYSDDGIFLYDENCNRILYIYASIIKFNEKGMILYFFDWLKFLIWIKKVLEYSKNRNIGLWNK